jgi:hypothetical protein
MHRPGDPRQTVVSGLSKVILCLLVPRFEHSTLVVRAKQHNHSAIVSLTRRNKFSEHGSRPWNQPENEHLRIFLDSLQGNPGKAVSKPKAAARKN